MTHIQDRLRVHLTTLNTRHSRLCNHLCIAYNERSLLTNSGRYLKLTFTSELHALAPVFCTTHRFTSFDPERIESAPSWQNLSNRTVAWRGLRTSEKQTDIH